MISIASCHECDWMAGAFYDGESTRLEFSCSSSFWRNASVSNDGFSLIKTSVPSGRRGRRWKNRVVRGSLDPGVRRTPRIEKFTCKRVVMPDYSREVFWHDAVGFCIGIARNFAKLFSIVCGPFELSSTTNCRIALLRSFASFHWFEVCIDVARARW